MEIRYFNEQVEQFIHDLDDDMYAKMEKCIGLLRRFGNNLGMPQSKHLLRRLFELRAHGNREVRLIYAFHEGYAVFLHGFIKKSQKTPPGEIDVALYRLRLLDRG